MRTAHFKSSELACKCCGVTKVNSELMAVLELVRVHFNSPVTINSGYRCEKHNLSVGGSKNSQHMQGTAADIVVKGFEPSEVYHFLSSIFPNSYGIGGYNTFTHVDVRQSKGRW